MRQKAKARRKRTKRSARRTLTVTSGTRHRLKDRGADKLYDLIWKRTIASQMKEALLEQTRWISKPNTDATKKIFRANGQTVKFDGFIRVYTEGRDDDASRRDRRQTAEARKRYAAHARRTRSQIQHFTEPPPRYTDATLVKALEAEGIGRPSTYAPTLSTIQERGYVEKVDKKYQSDRDRHFGERLARRKLSRNRRHQIHFAHRRRIRRDRRREK